MPQLAAYLFAQADAQTLFDVVSKGGAVGVLVIAVVAFVQGWIVPGKLFTRAIGERDEALAEIARLRSLYDRVIVLAAAANREAAEELKRLTEGR